MRSTEETELWVSWMSDVLQEQVLMVIMYFQHVQALT